MEDCFAWNKISGMLALKKIVTATLEIASFKAINILVCIMIGLILHNNNGKTILYCITCISAVTVGTLLPG